MRFVWLNFSVLVSAVAIASLVICARQAEADDGGHPLPSGLFGRLLAPFRSTFDSARSLFGHNDNNDNATTDTAAGSNVRRRAFEIYMRIYNKTYSSTEEMRRRMDLFYQRRKEIEQSIRDYAQGKLTFTMSENPFIDWDTNELNRLHGVEPPKSADELAPEERQALMDAKRSRRKRRSIKTQDEKNATLYTLEGDDNDKEFQDGDDAEFDFSDDYLDAGDHDDDDDDDDQGLIVKAGEQLPESKDWRLSGCVSPPLNQMLCGCCYAIATMGTLETMRCVKQQTGAILSPQQIVDCATPRAGYQNFGCEGGWPTRVLRYLQDHEVAARDACYPFVRKQNRCLLKYLLNKPGCTVSASPTNTQLTYRVLNNERDILRHVAQTGPVITVMKTTNKFLFYKDGIFDDPTCSRARDDVDHAIVIVGYGRENNMDYWLIKNSWGTQWGQSGYGKYRRGRNTCSIGHWGWVITS
jgi:hypothetical protein